MTAVFSKRPPCWCVICSSYPRPLSAFMLVAVSSAGCVWPHPQVWGARRVMELSRASLCPSVAYQLVGTKKMQQVLAEPGVLERSVVACGGALNIQWTVCQPHLLPTRLRYLYMTRCHRYTLHISPCPCRFVKDPAAVSKIRSTFAGLYSLEMVG